MMTMGDNHPGVFIHVSLKFFRGTEGKGLRTYRIMPPGSIVGRSLYAKTAFAAAKVTSLHVFRDVLVGSIVSKKIWMLGDMRSFKGT
jgi:hypothetical protein